MPLFNKILRPLRETFTPPKKRLPEIFTAAVLTFGGALGFPKVIDNAIPHPSTQWLEDNASILQIYATPQIEPPEQVIKSAIGNSILVLPASIVSMYMVASVMCMDNKLFPEKTDENEPSSKDTHVDRGEKKPPEP